MLKLRFKFPKGLTSGTIRFFKSNIFTPKWMMVYRARSITNFSNILLIIGPYLNGFIILDLWISFTLELNSRSHFLFEIVYHRVRSSSGICLIIKYIFFNISFINLLKCTKLFFFLNLNLVCLLFIIS